MLRRRSPLPSAVLVALALVLGAGAAAGQEAAKRPRVCLVLSGGGALGIAHVGVLQVLEELHVPIDCVAGTSMGAIVGGLYAAGYSPAELTDLALHTDWHDVLRDSPERRDLPFRRKVDDLTYLTRWELGFSGGKLRIPTGLIPGQKLGVMLRLLSLRAVDVHDFDRLPLPFRAVAADVGSGETVVLRDGDLAQALRASMAVPGLISPVEVEGRLLIDGGVVDNLPVDAARAMGADVIIAVDLGQPLVAKDRPESMASILSRTGSFLTRLNVERALAGVDVLIRPSLGKRGLLEFDAAREFLARGVSAARDRRDALTFFAVDDAEWRDYLARQRRTTPTIPIGSVTIDPGRGLALGTVTAGLHTHAGRPLDVALLQADIRRLYDLGEFETVDFTLTPEGDAHALTITGRPKSWGPNFLRFGLGLSSDLEGASSFNLLAAYTMTRLNRFGADLKTTAQVGETPAGSVELYQPLSASRVPFVAAGVAVSGYKSQIDVGGGPIQYRFVQGRVQLDLGLSLGRYGEVRLGVRHDSAVGRASNGSGGYPHYDSRDAGPHLALTIDQLDNVNFPRHGVLASGELYEARTAFGADEQYRRLDLSALAAGTVKRLTVVAFLHGSSALGGALPTAERLRLGGFLNLSGLPPGEVTGSYGGVASLFFLYRIGRMPAFGEGLYAALTLEAGNAWDSVQQASFGDLRRSAAIMFGADTWIGPVYLGHGWTSGGKDSFYLYVGRTF